MEKRHFTDHISKESINQMIPCFEPLFRNYDQGETILRYSDLPQKIAILLSGRARLYFIDESGESSLLESYKDGDIFGDVFSLPLQGLEYIVTADMPCRVIFINYQHIITPCEKSCQHHTQLINNLFIMTAQKSQNLSLHISILNQHTTRKKLLAYLNYARVTAGVNPFTLPISLGALAEYLCVDRSAMMRELRAMKREGILDSDKRTFRLLKE